LSACLSAPFRALHDRVFALGLWLFLGLGHANP
jgi:hypothetical protein